MKKQWIALLTGCVLVCSMLAGCGSKPQTSAPAAAGSDKGCTDEAILSQLKNDGTPEFVLDGTYYTLPLETSQLIQAGWSLETEEYDAAEVSLQPGERIYGELSKDDQEIDVAIVNAGTEPCKPAEGGTVVELEYSADKDQPNPDFFVTLNGINCAMSNAALQKALEGVDGYELNSAGNIDINRTVDDDEIAVYKERVIMACNIIINDLIGRLYRYDYRFGYDITLASEHSIAKKLSDNWQNEWEVEDYEAGDC